MEIYVIPRWGQARDIKQVQSEQQDNRHCLGWKKYFQIEIIAWSSLATKHCVFYPKKIRKKKEKK